MLTHPRALRRTRPAQLNLLNLCQVLQTGPGGHSARRKGSLSLEDGKLTSLRPSKAGLLQPSPILGCSYRKRILQHEHPPHWPYWGLLGPTGACWGLLGPMGACWGLLGPMRACWGLWGPAGAYGGLLGPAGACWGLDWRRADQDWCAICIMFCSICISIAGEGWLSPGRPEVLAGYSIGDEGCPSSRGNKF